MILGLLLFPSFLNFIFQFTRFLKFLDVSRARTNHEIRISTIFYAALLLMLIVIVPSWMQLVQDFRVHPFLWYYQLKSYSPFNFAALFFLTYMNKLLLYFSLLVISFCLVHLSLYRFYFSNLL